MEKGLQLRRLMAKGIRLVRDMRLVRASGLFDAKWYLHQNPDVAEAGINPLSHYLRRGGAEGRDPNPHFHNDWYLRQNPDVARMGVNPLVHYLRWGAAEGRNPSPFFDVRRYLQQNPNVARERIDPLLHYIRSGASETAPMLPPPSAASSRPSDYERWIRMRESRTQLPLTNCSYRPKVSIVMPVYNTPLKYLNCAIASVKSQTYENWELCICDDGSTNANIRPFLESHLRTDTRIKVVFSSTNDGISMASNRALALATGEFIGLLDHDDELSPKALSETVKLLQIHPDANVIYSDEDKLEPDGTRSDPFFKPDWSPELLLSCMYTCHFGVYRKELVDAVGGFRAGFEGSQDYDLMLRLVEKTQKIFHIPAILYHWRKAAGSTAMTTTAKKGSIEAGRKALEGHMQRRGIPASVYETSIPNLYRVRPQVSEQSLVSIIIPTKDCASLLQRCISSVEKATAYRNFEILIIDNNSSSEEAKKYLSDLPHQVIPFAESFSFSRIINFGVRHAHGNYFVFLNNDTEVISSDWLDSMLELCQLQGVGIVGAKLLYPNRTIQHAGVVLGLGGVAGHSHKFFAANSKGYCYALVSLRNYSAVTAACMMVKRDVFEMVGGFDENLPVAFNDVDFCLRVREAGFRIVWTPYAELYHHESATRGYGVDPNEIAYIKARWGAALNNDPYYNPNLTLDHENFALRV